MRIFATTIILLQLSLASIAQTWEVGLNLGGANYLGDLAPSLALNQTGIMSGISVKKNYSGYFSLNGSITYGRISGSDANFKVNQPRNLNFRSDLVEASFVYEFNFQKYVIGLRAKKFSPYVFGGLAMTYHNPKAELDNKWYKLRPLATEGQGINDNSTYSNFVLAVPMGGGLKWQIGDHFNTSTYISFRYCFTDYLDDVSGSYFDNDLLIQSKGEIAGRLADRGNTPSPAGKQRGNPDNNDWYAFFGISITYILDDPNCPSPAGKRRR